MAFAAGTRTAQIYMFVGELPRWEKLGDEERAYLDLYLERFVHGDSHLMPTFTRRDFVYGDIGGLPSGSYSIAVMADVEWTVPAGCEPPINRLAFRMHGRRRTETMEGIYSLVEDIDKPKRERERMALFADLFGRRALLEENQIAQTKEDTRRKEYYFGLHKSDQMLLSGWGGETEDDEDEEDLYA